MTHYNGSYPNEKGDYFFLWNIIMVTSKRNEGVFFKRRKKKEEDAPALFWLKNAVSTRNQGGSFNKHNSEVSDLTELELK